ncbi:MAG: hypothetical protein WC752_02035 [Patescibacteria group bacterium]|jgi:hypothetical protein
MDINLEREKQSIAEELDAISKKVPDLKKKNDPVLLKYNMELALKRLTQLYYLNFYHLEKSPADPETKKIAKDELLTEYRMEMIKWAVLFKQ